MHPRLQAWTVHGNLCSRLCLKCKIYLTPHTPPYAYVYARTTYTYAHTHVRHAFSSNRSAGMGRTLNAVLRARARHPPYQHRLIVAVWSCTHHASARATGPFMGLVFIE
jgi:hypothetical protein